MRRGVGRPGRGIVGAMATTAVVAGTAGAVHHRQEQRYQNQAQEQYADQAAVQSQQDIAAMQAQMAAMQSQQAQAASVPAGGSDVMAQLQQLSSMKDAGVLSDAEFQAAKAKLLGM